MAYGISSTGFSRPRLVDIQTEIQDQLRSSFGADINLNPGSVFTKLTGIFAEREDLVWSAMQDVYGSQYPDTAFGLSLDNVRAISGITRLASVASRVLSVRLFGTAGTLVPAGTQFSVINAPTSIFSTETDVTLVAGTDEVQTIGFSLVPTSGTWFINFYGQETSTLAFNASASAVQAALQALPFGAGITVTGNPTIGFTATFAGVSGKQFWPALIVTSSLLNGITPVTTSVTITIAGVEQGVVNVTATVTGPILANTGTLTVITTPVSGLDSVWNVVDAIRGRDLESDFDYRLRSAEELQSAGAATVEAIKAQLLAVEDVTNVVIFENDSSVEVDGRPPKSFESFVEGGDDQDIWDTLWLSKPAGIRTHGTEVGIVIDSSGQSQTLRFSRPDQVPIYVDLVIEISPDFPVDGVQLAKQAIVDKGLALGIGEDVIVYPYLISALSGIPGITDITIKVGTSPSPTLDDNIPIAVNETSTWNTAAVTVTTV